MGGTNAKMVSHMKGVMTKLVEADKPYQEELIHFYINALQQTGGAGGNKQKAQELVRNKICQDLVNMTAPALERMNEESRMHAVAREQFKRDGSGALGAGGFPPTPKMGTLSEDGPAPAAAPAAAAAPAGGAGAAAAGADFVKPFPSLLEEGKGPVVTEKEIAAAAALKPNADAKAAAGSGAGSGAGKGENAHWRLARAFLTQVSSFNAAERDLHLSRDELRKCMLDAANTLVHDLSEKESTKEAAVIHEIGTAMKNVDMSGLSF